jgi:hypothetical protein
MTQRGVARTGRAGLGSERRQDAESEAARERAQGRMPEANVRRPGTGNPERPYSHGMSTENVGGISSSAVA